MRTLIRYEELTFFFEIDTNIEIGEFVTALLPKCRLMIYNIDRILFKFMNIVALQVVGDDPLLLRSCMDDIPLVWSNLEYVNIISVQRDENGNVIPSKLSTIYTEYMIEKDDEMMARDMQREYMYDSGYRLPFSPPPSLPEDLPPRRLPLPPPPPLTLPSANLPLPPPAVPPPPTNLPRPNFPPVSPSLPTTIPFPSRRSGSTRSNTGATGRGHHRSRSRTILSENRSPPAGSTYRSRSYSPPAGGYFSRPVINNEPPRRRRSISNSPPPPATATTTTTARSRSRTPPPPADTVDMTRLWTIPPPSRHDTNPIHDMDDDDDIGDEGLVIRGINIPPSQYTAEVVEEDEREGWEQHMVREIYQATMRERNTGGGVTLSRLIAQRILTNALARHGPEPLIPNTEDIRVVITDEELHMCPIIEYSQLTAPRYSCCNICLENFDPDCSILMLNTCEHYFHELCIKRWLVCENNKCPICRVPTGDGIALT